MEKMPRRGSKGDEITLLVPVFWLQVTFSWKEIEKGLTSLIMVCVMMIALAISYGLAFQKSKAFSISIGGLWLKPWHKNLFSRKFGDGFSWILYV